MGARDAIARGAGLLLATALWLAPATSHAVSEYEVKAAFLLNFGKFVEWPPQTLPAGSLDICVLGSDPFGSDLDDTLAGRTVGSRSVQARRIADVSAARGCAIVFVSRADAERVSSVLASLRGAPVLIVGEQDRFADQGGMINFVEVDQKIRFEINETAAKKAGLKISSQLLKLATIVEAR
jgi:hypothetical protein